MTLDFSIIGVSFPYLFLDGMRLTLELTIVGASGGLVLGTLVALLRGSRRRLVRLGATLYVDVLRALPLILIIFWFYFLAPFVAAALMGGGTPPAIGAFTSAILALILFEGAYFCEIVRAGIQAVPSGQVRAALALGLSPARTMLLIVLPQAFRHVVPILLTQVIVLFQDTSLVSVISLTDFLGAASNVAERDGHIVELYLTAALTYFTICLSLSLVVRRQQRRLAVRARIG
ncbi:amino acid ABC transporter permease [Sphingomonas sp.]|uniref:amino acid ABC transporter permease n=1 Tax=Sphingomonas sp. TaxID=28214 RepID=UPI0025E69553|nr:amino acid ABC transporter permease [Sphingomonas sp.]